ncbi:hypothetical protein QYM36_008150 [Artemia franciscana]|uniref:Uncharacterized protein n=1 Tax=Artemia franciscana TaxID=6661 RepID=A0AA88IAR9_ARTSF|nr:hypothetical protein QYM36_008150 [Artemia franciscana]
MIPDPITGKKCHFYDFGSSDGSSLHGVGFLLQEKAESTSLEWEPIPNRTTWIRMLGHWFNTTIIVAYVPIRDSPVMQKDILQPAAE